MKNLSIQEIWKQNETLLEKTRKLNLDLSKELKLANAKSSLKSLLFLPVSTLIFFMLIGSYALYFVANHLETWYFVFSGAVVAFFSMLYVISSIRQLYKILALDYNAPVLKLQAELAQIKVVILTNLRITAWVLPFAPFIGLFFVEALFQWDLMALMNFNMIISFGLITILLEIISLIMLHWLKPKNINKKWMNWLLKGNGSQVDEALNFLDQIETFKSEP
ncbi:MAG: hypothetical protein ACNS62_16090 [Candidatus Cyclobacteriaceae bacterium M3_2C_046]